MENICAANDVVKVVAWVCLMRVIEKIQLKVSRSTSTRRCFR